MNASSLPKTDRARCTTVFITFLAASMMLGCTYRPQSFVTAPHGGIYVLQDTPSWNINWGLVKRKQPSVTREPDSFWKGDGVTGRARIVIDLSDQKALFYKGDALVGMSPVCTGSEQFPTPKGKFSVIEKDEDHYSSAYGDYIDHAGNILRTQIDRRKDPKPPGAKFDGAKMFWFMRVVGGVGMHEGYLPGYADSHGCIRLPSNMARIFYQNARLGTPVHIVE